MSDSPDIDELLENLNNTLTSLDKYENIDTFIDKLDAKNRKQLKKIKNVVWDINSKVGNIKDKVSKAYKRFKARTNSESNESANTEDISDKEVDSLVSNGSLEASIEEANRYSPVIRRRGKGIKKSSKGVDNQDDSEDDDDDCQTNDENQEDKLVGETTILTNNEAEPTEHENPTSDKSAVQATPEMSHNKNKLLSLGKNLDKILDTSMGTDLEENEEQTTEENSENTKTIEDKKKTSNYDSEENSNIDSDKTQKNADEDKEEEEPDSDSQESKKNTDEDEEDPNGDLVKSKTNKKRKKCKKNEADDSNNSSNKTKNNNHEDAQDSLTDADWTEDTVLNPEQNVVENETSYKENKVLPSPKIKLLSKRLLTPNENLMVMTSTPSKHQKSVTFDQSVILFSSSDEDTPKKSPLGKENDVTPLKSALRKTDKVVDLSDSESKENDIKRRNKKLYSDESDSEESSKSRKVRGRNRDVDGKENDVTPLKGALRKTDKVVDSSDSDSKENDVEKRNKKLYSDESDTEESSKSRRLRGRNREVKTKFPNLRDGQGDKMVKQAEKARKQSKTNKEGKIKDLLEENISLSGDDNDSKEEHEEESTKIKTRPLRSKKPEIERAHINDPKLKIPVIIRLPKFATGDLQKIYENTLPGKKKEEEKNSNNDKQENNRIRLTLKISKKNLGKQNKSSDDDQSSIEDIDNDGLDNDDDTLDSVMDSESQSVEMMDLTTACLTNDANQEDEPLSEATIVTNKESEQPIEHEVTKSNESVDGATPEKSQNKKLLLTLRKNQDNTEHEIIDTSTGTDLEENEEQTTEDNSENSKTDKCKKKTHNNIEDLNIDLDKSKKIIDEENQDKEAEVLNISDSDKSQKNIDKDKQDKVKSNISDSDKSKTNENGCEQDKEEQRSESDLENSKKNTDEDEQDKNEEEPLSDLVKSKTNEIPEQNVVENEKSSGENQVLPLPKIKLIDIGKLLAPNAKPLGMTPSPSKNQKSVTFDSSVIILSSSDEDTPKKSPRGKENDVTPLKSALRRTEKVIDLSDSDSEDNNRKKRNKKLYSDESDMEESSRSSRIRGRNREVKAKFSNLRKVREDRQAKHSGNDTRRSKRNQGRKKKDMIEECISLSDDTDSNVELEEKSTKKRTWSSRSKKPQIKEADINDPKFKRPVIIRLPKFPTEDLPQIYKDKKELLEIKNLCKIKLYSSRKKNETEEEEISNDDKQENKRIKLTLKINKKTLEKENKSSDDEPSSTEDNDNIGMDNDVDMLDLGLDSESQNAKEMEDLAAKVCLDQIKDSDEEVDKSKEESDEDKSGEKDKGSKKTQDKEKDEETKVNGKLSDSEGESNEDESNKKTKKNKDDKDIQEKELSGKKKKKNKSETEDSSSEEEEKSRKKKKTNKKGNEKDDSDESVDTDKETDKNGKKKLVIESSSDEEISQSKKASKSESRKRLKKKVISDSDSADGDKNDDTFKPVNSDSEASSHSSNSDDDEENLEKETKSKSRKRIKRVKDSSSDEEDKSTRKNLRRMIDRDSLSQTTLKAESEEKARKARIAEKQTKYNKIFELKADSVVDEVVLDFDEKTKEPLLSVHKKIVKQLKPHQVVGIKFMWDACFESLDRASKTAGSGCILAHCMGLGKTLQVIALSHTLLMNQKQTKVERILVVCPLNTVLNWKSEFKKWMPDTDDFEIFELVSCKTNSINQERGYIVKCWQEEGGVLIIGYNMFRTLSNPDNKTISKKLRQTFQSGLVDPGPDLVVCDEGHLLKNEKTNLSIAMNRIKTARRIVLTGTPLQNNLREYWCMVQFIKPNLLGTYKEYMNRFVNPITNGQYTDSTQHDIMVMRRRSHVLHKLLDGVVQRQDYEVLAPYLPPKYEYVIFVQLTDVQIKLYEHYTEKLAKQNDGSNRTSFLFADFQAFQRICTHPRVLFDKSIEDRDKKERNGDESEESEGSIADFIDDDSDLAESTPEESSNSDSGGSDASSSSHKKKKKEKKSEKASSGPKTRLTRAQAAQKRDDGEVVTLDITEEADFGPKQWWEEYIAKSELDNINHSSKLFLLFQLLKECEDIGDKILVFSQSLYTLNCIEYFLAKIDEATQSGKPETVGGHSGSWALGLDYFRLDGSSSCDNRASWCDQFNNPKNTRARLFLISTKAGGLGINLVAANRVIIFDVSWNPSHDIQSIYRVYRFGQTKPSYIYRFVTHGAMEMKIYERQVTKQAISKRVIDEQQIDRHYSQNDIQELYKTDLKPKEDRPIPLVPKDVLLGEMLQKYDKTIYKYHEHQTLLENKQDEELNEDERKAAWDEFENEKVLRKTTVASFGNTNLGGAFNSGALTYQPQLIQLALANLIRKDHPDWADVQIKGVLPALVAQLQMQMKEQDYSLFKRVTQEIQVMQSLHMQQAYFRQLQQQQQQLQQQQLQQQQQQQSLNPYLITPEELRLLQMGKDVQQSFSGVPGQARAGGSGVKYVAGKSSKSIRTTSSAPAPSTDVAATSASMSNDIIELND